eukprot:scaffold49788_cov21-Phaeocystis_antarctica.AAC.1
MRRGEGWGEGLGEGWGEGLGEGWGESEGWVQGQGELRCTTSWLLVVNRPSGSKSAPARLPTASPPQEDETGDEQEGEPSPSPSPSP